MAFTWRTVAQGQTRGKKEHFNEIQQAVDQLLDNLNMPPAVDMTDCVLLLHLDTDANDSSGRGNNGTLSGSGTSIGGTGKFGGCYEADDTDDGGHIQIPTSTDFNFAGGAGFSFFLWFNKSGTVESPDNDNEVMASRYGTDHSVNTWWFGGTYGADTLELDFYPADDADDVLLYSPNAINDGEWHHGGWVYDPVAGEVRLYLDGHMVDSGSTTPAAFTSTNPLNLGAYGSTNDTYEYIGKLDEVVAFKRALSNGEVRSLYMRGLLPGTTTGIPAIAVHDDFNRGNGDLGSSWTNFATNAGDTKIIDHKIGNLNAGVTDAAWIFTGEEFNSDQEAEVEISVLPSEGTAYFYNVVRASGLNGYLSITAWNGATWTAYFYRLDSGTANYVATFAAGGTFPAGTRVALRVVGDSFTFWMNGITQIGTAYTDSTYSSGYPGLGIAYSSTLRLDNFVGRGIPDWRELPVSAREKIQFRDIQELRDGLDFVYNNNYCSSHNSVHDSANNNNVETVNNAADHTSHNTGVETGNNATDHSSHNTNVETVNNAADHSTHDTGVETGNLAADHSNHNSNVETVNNAADHTSHNTNVETGNNAADHQTHNNNVDTGNNAADHQTHNANVETGNNAADHSTHDTNRETGNLASDHSSHNTNVETGNNATNWSSHNTNVETGNNAADHQSYNNNVETSHQNTNHSNYNNNVETWHNNTNYSNYGSESETGNNAANHQAYYNNVDNTHNGTNNASVTSDKRLKKEIVYF
jgi:hypothetical protein